MAGEAAAEGSGSGSTYPVKEAGQKAESGKPAIAQDRAMQIAREMFPDLLEGKDLDIQLQDDYMGDSSGIWRLSWNNPNPGGRRMEHISVGIDADSGALVDLHYYDPGAGLEGSVTPLTEEAARQKAIEYAGKYRPAEFGRTRLAENDYFGYYSGGAMKNTYNFYWERLENGVPVEGDGVNVGVDLFNGRLTYFSVNWHREAVFQQPGTMPEGMEQKVLSELGLILCYQVPEGVKTNLTGVPEAKLVYRLNSPGMLRISPGSGEALTSEGKTIPLSQYKRFSGLPDTAAGGAIEGSGSVNRSDQKISQAEGLKAARDFFRKIGIDEEVRRSGGGSGSGVFYDEHWSYGLADEENWNPGQQHKNYSVGVDAFTGEVHSFNPFSMYADQGLDSAQKITREDARKKAIDFIRLVSPEKLGQVVEERQQDESYTKFGAGYAFNFVRLVNGIPFLQDGITIFVSAGGEITSYNCDWHAVKFPSTEGLITREDAEKIFQEKMRLKPAYFFPLEGEEPRPGTKPALALVFDSRRDMGIDARTGQLVAVDIMTAQPEGKPGAVVPQEHWAAASLAVLADSGLLPAEGFNPDGPVSRRDAVRVLMSAMDRNYGYDMNQQSSGKASFTDVSPNDRDYDVIQSAVRKGVLVGGGCFSPEQPVLREELAVWLVRALGYSEVAEMPVKIELKAADADQVSWKARNYVAIAWGLNLIKGDENNLFRPADHATWAELASLVTRAAPRLRSALQW